MSKEYKHYLKKKTDEELIKILFFEKENFNKEAISTVEEIIKERSLTNEEISKTKKRVRVKINKEKKKLRDLEKEKENKGWFEKIFYFFLHG